MIKPGSYAPACSHTISRLVQKYLDPECVKVAEGDRAVTTALLDERFDKICFTGSGFVGKIVLQAAAKHLTPCLLELGGKSPCIVDKSADLEHAAQRLAWGAFLNGGQTCVRPDFCLVHADVADRFLKILAKTIKQFYSEDAQKTEWFGRCINAAAFKRLQGILQASERRVYCGGKADAADKYIEPTVLDYGADLAAFAACEAMQDENFGPILPVARFTDLEQVVAMVKRLPTGKPLALYAFSSDAKFVSAIKRRTTSGGLCINDVLMHMVNHDLPFGGVGASGMGSYHGHRSFLAFTHEKAVLHKSAALDQSPLLKPFLAARFPPYTPTKQRLVKFFASRPIELLVNVHRHALTCIVLVAALLWYVAAAVGMHVSVSFK